MRNRRWSLIPALALLHTAIPVAAQPSLELAAAQNAAATWSPDVPVPSGLHAPMTDRLSGIAARLDAGDIRRLAMLCRNAPQVGWPAEIPVLGYLQFHRANGVHTLRLGLTRDRSLLLASADSGTPGGGPVEIAIDGWETLIEALLAPPSGRAPPTELLAGEVIPLAQPYQPSLILLDTAAVESRLAGGHATVLDQTDRLLAEEQFFVRMPTTYDPSVPLGLLVWVDAGDDGRPPDVLNTAADELGLVMIGAANAGNSRLVTDRYQLALDAVATLETRLFIDPRRVYITGLSGGGRVSAAAVACFADVFTGAVPIVGLSIWAPVPLGDGRFVVAGYRKPDAALWRLFREHRVAPMSGPLDFNYMEITNAVRMMRRENLSVQLFEYPDMAHQLPTAERFADALRWVDEPARLARERSAAEAQALLVSYLRKFGETPVSALAQRRILERVATIGPWSPAAWRACELLGVVNARPDPPKPRP